jgi:adenosylmethionine-8-amino-7-oxononanoate aminotransferase
VLAAVQLDPERLAANPGLPAVVAAGARKRGVLVRPMVSAVAVSPPLTFTDEHIDLLTDALRGGLDDAG